jgi:hypothetical protein
MWNVRDAAPQITDRLLTETRIPHFLSEVTQLDKDLRQRILPLMKTPPPLPVMTFVSRLSIDLLRLEMHEF